MYIKSSSSNAEYIKAKNFRIKNNYCLTHIDGEKIKISFGDYIVKLGSSFKVYSEEEFKNDFKSFINEKEED